MKNVVTIILLLLGVLNVNAQKRDYNWLFGDSTGLSFHSDPPVPISGSMKVLESNATISDEDGNLLFYTDGVKVWNRMHYLMPNGNGLKSNPTITQGALILPSPSDTDEYYIFTINHHGFWYSVVDMRQDSSRGDVMIKNIRLLNCNHVLNQCFSEHLQAVRHANGKDWWVMIHGLSSNRYIRFLVTGHGVSDSMSQAIGSYITYTVADEIGQMKFSLLGDKLVFVNLGGVIQAHYFDRCTGLLYNTIFQARSPRLKFYGCSFSPDGKLLYVSTFANNIDYIYQIDFHTSAPLNNPTTIFEETKNNFALNQQQLGPDGKIYINASQTVINPPSDSFNTHLSVINEPNNIGISCDFQAYHISLIGKVSFIGLPNMPNYNLGPVPIYAIDTPQLQYTICKGDSLPIGIADTLPEIVYSWQSVAGGWQSTEMLPVVAPQTTTTYYLTRTDTAATYSCNERYDTITVFVFEADSVFIDTTVMAGTVYWGNIIHADTTLIFTYKRTGQCDSVVVHDVEVVTGVAASPLGGWGVRVWPNPANDKFYIEIKTRQVSGNLTGLAEAEFALYNVLGEKVRVQNLEPLPTSATSGSRIDVSGLPEGIYLSEVQAGTQKVRGKIVILR